MGCLGFNPLLMGGYRDDKWLRVFGAIISLVLPAIVLYFVPLLLHGVLTLGLMVSMFTESYEYGLASLPIVYSSLVLLTWEALKYVSKRF